MRASTNTFSDLIKKPRRDERRARGRSTPTDLTVCHVMLSGEDRPFTGWVNDISVDGVGFVCERSLPQETVLTITLFNAASTFALEVEVKVARCSMQPSGSSLVGCRFVEPLTYDNLLPFLT